VILVDLMVIGVSASDHAEARFLPRKVLQTNCHKEADDLKLSCAALTISRLAMVAGEFAKDRALRVAVVNLQDPVQQLIW
jgi:hypothetical protein